MGPWNALCKRAIACRDDQPDMETSVQHSNMTKESNGPKGFAIQFASCRDVCARISSFVSGWRQQALR